VDDDRCVFCEHDSEDVDHLLMECRFAYEVWCGMYSWLGCCMVQHNLLKHHFVQFAGEEAEEISFYVLACYLLVFMVA